MWSSELQCHVNSGLKTEAVCSSETLLLTYKFTWCYIPDDHNDWSLNATKSSQVISCMSMAVQSIISVNVSIFIIRINDPPGRSTNEIS
jgi:hypothetical protein